MKLIDENAAIEAVRKALSEYNGEYDCRSRYGVIADAIENLKELPSSQPDIIRCKDCMWRNKDNACENMYDRDGFWPEVEPNGFCSWAERREE